jgi:peroxiredoxin Q/BCP
MIAPGDRPSDFTLTDHEGRAVQLSALRGKPVVLFFYPKADTPGCTQEACDFRDQSAAWADAGVTVLGVSADPVKRQASFASKYGLSMPLLADPDRAVLGPWGVWGEKKQYGRTYEGIIRTTVLLDAEGVVAQVWSPVKVKGHVEAVLAAVRAT